MRILPFAGRHLQVPTLRRRWIVALFCSALAPLPVVGITGYESSLILSPLFALLGMAVGVDRVRAIRTTTSGGSSVRRIRQLTRTIGAELSLLWLVAGAIQTLAILGQRNCDPLNGWLFFAFGPVTTSLLGATCGVWGASLAHRRMAQLSLASIPFWACLTLGLWRLYVDPVVFAFDPFWGHFSGAIYDEDVSIGSTYIWFRVYNLMVTIAAWVWWALVIDPDTLRVRRRLPTTPMRWGSALLLTSIGAWMGWHADSLGFHATRSSVETVLSLRHETEHFVIHYGPRSQAAREISAIAAEHEFAWTRLEAILGRAPSTPIHSFVFESAAQKRRLIGAGRVEVAPPWRGHLYLNHRPYPHDALHHELAHVFESTIGDPLFGLSLAGLEPNLGLVEGLATALAPRSQSGLGLHDQAAILDELELRPPLATVMGAGFWTQASPRAYTVAGSFCQWLVDRYGIEHLVRLYGTGGDFVDVYAQSLADLETQWLGFLRTRPLDPDAVAMIQERFSASSIFERPCAHRVADLSRRVVEADARGQSLPKIEALETLCTLEPGQPRHQLALTLALAQMGNFPAAHRVLVDLQGQQLSATLRGRVLESRGDIDLLTGDLAGATANYQQALALPLERDQRRLLELKAIAANDAELAPLIRQYLGLFEDEDDTISAVVTRIYFASRIRSLPGYRTLGSYLLALQLRSAQAHEEAVFLFEQSLTPGPGDVELPGSTFIHAARERLLESYAITGRLSRAQLLLEQWAAGLPTSGGDQAEASMWEERLRFLRQSAPGAAP